MTYCVKIYSRITSQKCYVIELREMGKFVNASQTFACTVRQPLLSVRNTVQDLQQIPATLKNTEP